MDDSHRLTGDAYGLVYPQGRGELLIRGDIRELRLQEERGQDVPTKLTNVISVP